MLKQRILTALILAPLVLLAIFAVPHVFVMALLALLMLAAAWEWSAFPGFRQGAMRFAYVLIIAALIAAIWTANTVDRDVSALIYVALLWWLGALLWVVAFPTRVNRASAALAGLLVLVPAWFALVRLHAAHPQWVLFLLLLVVAADVGAYFAGRRFGRHKLAPRVSPGKTWEGALGGVVAAAMLAAIGVWWFETNAVPFVLLCALVVAASIVGDLTESMFKRHAGLKDSGTLLPGHGGVLDRIDSITAAAPLFLLGAERLGLLR